MMSCRATPTLELRAERKAVPKGKLTNLPTFLMSRSTSWLLIAQIRTQIISLCSAVFHTKLKAQQHLFSFYCFSISRYFFDSAVKPIVKMYSSSVILSTPNLCLMKDTSVGGNLHLTGVAQPPLSPTYYLMSRSIFSFPSIPFSSLKNFSTAWHAFCSTFCLIKVGVFHLII